MRANVRTETSAQQKMEAWQLVAKLCAQAQAALVQVNEGPYELVQLHDAVPDDGQRRSNVQQA